MRFSSATMRTVVTEIIGVVLVMVLLLAMLISTFSFLADEGGFVGLRHVFLHEKGKHRASALHRKLLHWQWKNPTGSEKIRDPPAPLSTGIPTYTVQIMNMCAAGCDISGIHLHCGWFSSARLIDPKIFKRLRYNDCLVNDGKPLVTGDVLTFEYANTFSYPLCSCCFRASMFHNKIAVSDKNSFFIKGSHMKDFDGNDCIDYVGSRGPAIIGHNADDETDSKQSDHVMFVHSHGNVLDYWLALEHSVAPWFYFSVLRTDIYLHPWLKQLRKGPAWCPMSSTECFGGDGDQSSSKHRNGTNNEGEICAIILEPVVENGGFIAPKPEAVRKIIKENNALLISGEVMTRFCLNQDVKNTWIRSPVNLFKAFIIDAGKKTGRAIRGGYIRGMFGYFFTEGLVYNLADAKKSYTAKFARIFKEC
uniref:Uncharacterized protein n=1 Tax=Salix viminalis TaxID=40686 RepID=A0A6N2MVS5_SALVM